VSQKPILLSQHGVPSVPSSDTLAEAVLWDYHCAFMSESNTTLEVTFNETRVVTYSIELRDVDGVAEIVVSASSGALPLVLIPDTALIRTDDGAYRYRMSDGTLLLFEDVGTMSVRTLVIERLDVIDAQSVRVSMEEVSLEPLLPFVENLQRIDIGDRPATMATHLTSLLQTLLGHSPFATQPASIECRYAYTIGGMPIEAPVLLVVRQEIAIGFDEELIGQIASGIQQWLDTIQPPTTDARLVLDLTLWNSIPRTDAPLLHLANVSLAMTAVVPA
jgi:hypothetical protein